MITAKNYFYCIKIDFNNSKNFRPFYDEKGILLPKSSFDVGQDICDCLREDCSGCFFACKACGSFKCGISCRCNRNTYYEKIEFEGMAKFRYMPGQMDID